MVNPYRKFLDGSAQSGHTREKVKCPDGRRIDKPVPYDTWVNKHPSSFTNLPVPPKKNFKKRLIYKSILSFPRPGENISKTLPTKSQGQNCLPRCCCSNSTSNLTDFWHLPSSKWTLDSLRCFPTQQPLFLHVFPHKKRHCRNHKAWRG